MTSCFCGSKHRDPAKLQEEKLRKESKKQNEIINKGLKQEKKLYKATIKLLLLGAGESGKSTVVKQMRIIHTSRYTNDERKKTTSDIKSNVKDTILSILNAMERYSICLNDEKLQHAREYILENATKDNFDYPNEFWDYCEQLWSNEDVKLCATKGFEYCLMDSAQYFLDRLNAIRKQDFLPTDQDILRCRKLTTGILETKFEFKKTHFHIFDVGGQRDERRKWIQCFSEVTAVIFVADISAYNMTLREDGRVNRLRESLHLFRTIWVNRWLRRVNIILFLNKYDIFAEKIASNKSKLEEYFPEYESYEPPSSRDLNKRYKVDNEHPDVTRAKMFVLDLFIDITNEDVEESLNAINLFEKTYGITTNNASNVVNNGGSSSGGGVSSMNSNVINNNQSNNTTTNNNININNINNQNSIVQNDVLNNPKKKLCKSRYLLCDE